MLHVAHGTSKYSRSLTDICLRNPAEAWLTCALPRILPGPCRSPACSPCSRTRRRVRRTSRTSRSEEHTSELQSHVNLVCRLLLEKKKLQPDIEATTKYLEPVLHSAQSLETS